MNVIIVSNILDKRTGNKPLKATSHMILDHRWTQCGRLYSSTDERTDRRPTCLTCRDIFDAEIHPPTE